MPATLLAPGLLDVDAAALASDATLRRVAARATAAAVDDGESELLRLLGLPAMAAAPLAALGAGLEVGSDWVARADPVTTLVTHDDVRIVARVDDLDEPEARALRILLDRHFADDGLAFAAARRDAWFVRSARPHALEAAPLATVVGRPLRDRLPGGSDAARWRRWWTEVQMLLHEHPLGLRATAPVHALWFASGATLPRPLPIAPACFATAMRHGDVLRGLARTHGATAHAADAPPTAAGTNAPCAIVADPVVSAQSFASLTSRVLPPLLAALDHGAIDRLDLIGSGRQRAARWTLRRAGLAARLFPGRADFVAPAGDET
jgi:hypothetical protein